MTDFITFARAHGVEIDPSRLYASDKIKRCPTTDKPRSTNGAYFWDGGRGWVFNWSAEARVQWFEDPSAKAWTEEEKRAWAMKRRASAAEADRKHENAALHAAMLLRSTVPGSHDYLIRKGLSHIDGLVLPQGELLVPMRNLATNELQGAQIIRWIESEMKWEKKMVPGMRAKGAVLRLGARTAAETIFCEGYATGLSIELAVRQMRLNAAVLVCFSDSNMVHVASLLTKGRRLVFADNDTSGAGERAARETGLPYCMSAKEGEDANDVHKRGGLLPVCGLLMEARRQEFAVP
ncbi:toprim domain-containing protein [Variovorax sp. RT4R15]|uniref:toprim domain-containing protein n=1 Tax=Variovorax sp. RT4R15 TaxID=3443737 RepID=UPI003F447A0A